MTPQRQILLISALAILAFFGLRALPDTQDRVHMVRDILRSLGEPVTAEKPKVAS